MQRWYNFTDKCKIERQKFAVIQERTNFKLVLKTFKLWLSKTFGNELQEEEQEQLSENSLILRKYVVNSNRTEEM